MLVSLNWLTTYLDSESLPDPQELASLLNRHSYEVEGIEERGDDVIFDLDILPNRASDSLSHIGIAREIATLVDVKMVLPEGDEVDGRGDNELVSLSVDESIARRALKCVISGITVGASPDWLVERLASVGQRSINNIVDITNFVMLETGQPVHAFDYDKVAGEGAKEIKIRFAKDGETIKLLDEKEYTLDSSIPVIADDEKALDVAGIKGGETSGIDENTTRVLLSSCSFNPTIIRRASQKLNLRTDASKRFENNVPAVLAASAMGRLSSLVKDIAGGESSTVVDLYPSPQEPISVSFSIEEVNSLLGTDISEEEVEDILTRLQFNVLSMGDGFVVSAPFWRTDISLPADVMEEIGRIYGYDRIESVVPTKEEGNISKTHYYKEHIRDILVEAGFSEVYLYTFRNEGEIEVKNKIASDKGFLRTNLSDGIREALEDNMRWEPILGEGSLKMFEIGTVFENDREYPALAIGASDDEPVEQAVTVLKEAGFDVDGEISGGVWEIDLEEIFETLPDPEDADLAEIEDESFSFTPISPYPFVLRDVAVWVPVDVDEEVVRDVIEEKAGEMLVRLSRFDEYEKDGRISYAFNLVFQSPEKTLSDEEVNDIMDDVYGSLEEKEGWETR
ncbi:MAG: phenylalanine--tRNA ligase subunit beta [Candidatus Paceibacterota bacterium]